MGTASRASTEKVTHRLPAPELACSPEDVPGSPRYDIGGLLDRLCEATNVQH